MMQPKVLPFSLGKLKEIYTVVLAIPTRMNLPARLQLEGVESAVATASGMNAIFTTFAAHLKAGDHVISARPSLGTLPIS